MRQVAFLILLLYTSLANAQAWQRIDLTAGVPPNQGLRDGFFFNDTGFVIGAGGYIYRTNDFFYSFSVDSEYKGVSLYALSFPDRDTGYIAASQTQGGLLKTTNAGNSWNPITNSLDSIADWGENLVFTNTHFGLNVHYNNHSLRYTNNGGITWVDDSISNHVCQLVNRLQHLKDSIFYILCSDDSTAFNGLMGQLHLLKSTDWGLNWNEIGSFYATGLGDFALTDDTTIIIAVDRRILKSNNGGFSFSAKMHSFNISDAFPYNFHAISFVNRDTGFVLYPDGSLFRTVDAAENWAKSDFALYNPFSGTNFVFAVSGEKIAIGSNGTGELYISRSGGGIWTGIEEKIDNSMLTIFPNPGSSQLNGNFNSGSAKISIEITTIDDRIAIPYRTVQSGRFEIDISQLSRGMYFLIIQDEKQRCVKKFLKQ